MAVLFIAWIYFLSRLNKAKLYFFKFIIGSLGLFFLGAYVAREGLSGIVKYGITYPLWLIGNATGLFTAYVKDAVVTVFYKNTALSYYISYECSGVIETLVYLSILAFYPVYSTLQKIRFALVGIVYIVIMNIFRLLIITLVVKYFGQTYFFFVHVILSRVIFFAFMVLLYYEVFTKSHILEQKVGKMYA